MNDSGKNSAKNMSPLRASDDDAGSALLEYCFMADVCTAEEIMFFEAS